MDMHEAMEAEDSRYKEAMKLTVQSTLPELEIQERLQLLADESKARQRAIFNEYWYPKGSLSK